MKKAIIYIRVSTDEQADKGYSLRHQEEFLRKYCELNLIQVVELIREDYSAKTFNRPAFQEMLKRLKVRKLNANVLLFTKWDRFSRNAPEAYAMISQLNKLGLDQQAIEQPLDLSIPENKIMLAFYLSAPEVENDRRALSTIVGMRRALKEGRWMSTAPRGYDNVTLENGKKLIKPNAHAPHIVWAFEQLATGKYNGEQVRRMSLERGFIVDRNRFNIIIKSSVYYGRINIPAYKKEEACSVIGTHEPLISKELFETVQDVLTGKRRKKKYIITPKEELPLRGFLNCRLCGNKLTGSASVGGTGIKHFYYHCTKGCKERIKAHDVNQTFAAQLNKFVLKKGVAELYELVLKKVRQTNQDDSVKSNRNIQSDIQKLKERLDKAECMMLDGEMTMPEYKEIKCKIEPKIEELQLEQIGNNHAESELKAFLKQGLQALKQLGDLFTKADVLGKQAILRSTLVENLVFSDGQVRTEKLNPLASLCFTIEAAFSGFENEKGEQNALLSPMVAGE
jgi:site-specific DNA recombinase